MFLARFCNHQNSEGKAVAANHITPTQRVIITSSIKPTYAFVESLKISIGLCQARLSFIFFYFRCADV